MVEQVANQGACVIVGRCADYVLRERDDVINVFIHADEKDKVARAKTSYEVDLRDVEKSILKIDKRRANYYEYYTDRTWGKAENYDISLNSSTFGLEGCVDIIMELMKKVEEHGR